MSENDFLLARTEDLIWREANGEPMVFSSFLTAEEAALVGEFCAKRKAPHYLFGGYDDSERKMLSISEIEPEILKEAFPIVLLRIIGVDPNAISNRDVLGALMGTGIRREMLGDIIVRQGIAAFFVCEQIAEFLIQTVDSIGRYRVSLEVAESDFLVPPPLFESVRTTVPSLRMDAVISSIAHVSRDQAGKLIEDKLVQINHKTIEKKIKEINAGDRLVVRGFGKWIIDDCGELSKKGRIVLHCRKYI